MRKAKINQSRAALVAAVSAWAACATTQAAVSYNTYNATPVAQGQTNGVNNPAETISFEGQGSLNKVIATAAFAYLNLTGTSGTQTITLNNGPATTQYPFGSPVEYQNSSGSTNSYLNLASQNFTAADTGLGTSSAAVVAQNASALRLEYHWDGTVDGSNDLINDQIGYNQATGPVSPLGGANRGPTSANPIIVNGNTFSGPASAPANTNLGNAAALNGFNLNQNTGGMTNAYNIYNTYSSANYDQAGNNLLGGTNRVQFSFSDYKTIDYSSAGTPSVFAAPGTAGYGLGNPALPTTNNILGIGVAGAREAYQSGSIANMPTSNIDPGTVSKTVTAGTAYASGPWNSAGLDNLSSTPVAANAVVMAANPGTGLSRLNLGDSQWLQTTGRLANGLQFNAVTRDADLGQRPSFATATGIDGTWAVGVNDGGDTTITANAALQHSVGSMKFSGKSSDTEVLNTIAQSRMAAGATGLNYAIGTKNYAPVRSLDIDFTDQTDPTLSGGGTDDSKFIQPNLANISTYAYQAVLLGYVTTVKAPNATALANYMTANPTLTQAQAWAQMGSFNSSNPSDPTVTGIKGDTTGDVAKFLTNLLNSQATYQSLTTSYDPADAFLNNSYLLPDLLQNQRDPTTGAITPNPNYNAAAYTDVQQIYDSGSNIKFDVDATGSGRVTETIGTASYYGQAAGSTPNFNGQIPINARDSNGNLVTTDRTLEPGGNWLFGNFNQNGVRDLSAVESGLAAAKALYAIEPTGTTGTNSAFNVSSGTANAYNSTPVTYTDVNGVSHTLTKGDLIVMGDYLSTGRFDGASLRALARGAAASDTSGNGYSTGTISGGQTNFADTVRNALLRKNDAMNYMETNTADATFDSTGNPLNASAFLRETGHAVLTEPGVNTAAGVPRNATALSTLDPDSGLEQFTYDTTGNYTFDKHDVNSDGVVDFNDAVLVDQFNGDSYTNMTEQLAATEQTPVTGAVQSISLTYVQQIDGESTIGAADLAQLNTGLTGAGNTNWYDYTLTKSGPGTITWARTSGTVTVYTGASMQISAGTVHVSSAIDPFTDSSAASTATTGDTSQSLAITVTSGGTLQYTGASVTGFQIDRLASLNISSGGLVLIDPSSNHSNRTLLVTSALSIATTGRLDLGNNDLDVKGGDLSTLTTLVAKGYNAGGWNGSTGIISAAAAADSTHLTALGIILNNTGSTAPLYGIGAFDGSSPAATDVLIKYTYYGDTNLDGVVDGTDYSRIDASFGTHATGWYNGDFNYDGVIDGSDYTLMDNAFNTQSVVLTSQIASPDAQVTDQIAGQISSSTTAVPEPATVSAMILMAAGLLVRRKRRQTKSQ